MEPTKLLAHCSRWLRMAAGSAALFGTVPASGDPMVTEDISPYVGETFWRVEDRRSIVWDVATETRLPHRDHIEMAGRRVAAIIDYQVNEKRELSVRREVIYPQLRVHPSNTSPVWFEFRSYLRQTYVDEDLPVLLVNQVRHEFGSLDSVKIDGALRFRHAPVDGVRLERVLLPSMEERLLIERWTVTNLSDRERTVVLLPIQKRRELAGPDGRYLLQARSMAEGDAAVLKPGQSEDFAIYFEALLEDESPVAVSPERVVEQRESFVAEMANNLRLRTPDPVIDTLFFFAKIRAAENIFESRLGLIHSPGGGNYYVGVWANDQAEYSGPFFPYLGYEPGNEAALNAYLAFLDNLPEGDEKIVSSFEMQGDLTCCGKDRGDAAMLAYGASQFALANGDADVAARIWPLIEWGLDYCRRRLNEHGVVSSQSDEMEGRIPTGEANLATSSLYYGALQQAASLARSLNLDAGVAANLAERARQLEAAIESYFGAEIAGLHTYRYFEGHQALRHWIGLPLVVGLHGRSGDTLTALFDQMWTENGVRVEWSPENADMDLFWDRGTLYALRGAFLAGAPDLALDRWRAYSETRLIGFHVPYPVEAWPENDMRHLSAESALYARIATEGLLGISPNGFSGFSLRPSLPEAWKAKGYEMGNLRLQGRELDIRIQSANANELLVRVSEAGGELVEQLIKEGAAIQVELD